MNIWTALGGIVAILALAGSILMHLFKTTWWMATLTASITGLTETVKKIEERVIKFEGEFCTKTEKDKDLGRIEAAIQAAHRRIDDMNNMNGRH